MSTNPPLSRAEELAAEFLEQIEAGADPGLEEYAERLQGASDREEFRTLVGSAQAVRGLLPIQVKPGRTLGGRYRLVREIGAGGMGKVFEGVDEQLGRHVAVKILTALGNAHYDPEELFMRESRLLAALQHPNIVAVHEAGLDGDVHYAVMDLVEGTPLNTVLARVQRAVEDAGESVPRTGSMMADAIGRPAPEGREVILDQDSWVRTVVAVLLEVARTLEAAHAKNVIHRDLKPGNVLLRGDGTPVVLDFGLAGRVDQHVAGSVTTGLMGSPAYLAPEQARTNRSGADPRSDVYQLGLMLYECLTLHKAFPDEDGTWMTMRDRIIRGDFRRPRAWDRRIPDELESICLKALELEPRRRYQTAAEMRADLERFMTGLEVPLAARGGAVGNAARSTRYFARRHKGKLAAAAVLLVAILVAQQFRPEPGFTDLQAWAGPVGSSQRVTDGSLVSPADLMGVTFESDESQVVYAVSVWGGTPERPDFVAAMRPCPVVGGELCESEQDGPYGLPVDAGEHALACTRIGDFNPEMPYEGLWVFHGTDPSEHLEKWLAALDSIDPQGVPFDRAWAEFQDPVGRVTRGGRVGGLSAAESARLVQGLQEAQLLGEDDWPLDTPKRFSVLVQVRPGTD